MLRFMSTSYYEINTLAVCQQLVKDRAVRHKLELFTAGHYFNHPDVFTNSVDAPFRAASCVPVVKRIVQPVPFATLKYGQCDPYVRQGLGIFDATSTTAPLYAEGVWLI